MLKQPTYLIYIFDVKRIFNIILFIFEVININNVHANDRSNTTIKMVNFNSNAVY